LGKDITVFLRDVVRVGAAGLRSAGGVYQKVRRSLENQRKYLRKEATTALSSGSSFFSTSGSGS